MIKSLLMVFIGLMIANYFYQFISAGDYSIALERTFFQGVALIAAYWLVPGA